ncbi:hypothetical protein VP01_452g1 [Puccinia sorghi]|uniref:Uncharacterized protein n=1 Tax=Puccinia sorghi TaxID=27349 RepID=A0A0L6UNZ1_9BASI|nr:hypothetical protein VP01_452g1 [Puccinia sorghi]
MVALGINLFQFPPPSLHFNYHKGTPQVVIKVFPAGSTSYVDFIEKVALESNNQFTSASPLIQDATRAGTPPIEWLVYLLCSPSLPQFTKDLEANLGKDVVIVHPGLQLRMESPGVSRLLGMPPCPGFISKIILTILMLNSCLVFSKILLTFTWKSCTNSISQTKKYNTEFLVFIKPCNPNQYILLTIGAIWMWACALVSPHCFILGSEIH